MVPGDLGGFVGKSCTHGRDKLTVLGDRTAPDLLAVRLCLEAQAHLRADLAAHRLEMDVVRRTRDRRMEPLICSTRCLTVGRRDVLREGLLHRLDVLVGAAFGRRPGDEGLDEAPQVEQPFELLPARYERPSDHLGGLGTPARPDVRTAVAAALDVDVARSRESVERLADARPAHAEKSCQLSLGRQPLARDELAESDGGDQPLGDLLTRVAKPERHEAGSRFRRIDGDRG